MQNYIDIESWNPTEGIELTEEQLAVVKNTQKNLAIIAGPGTGKTEVLAQKATFLLQTKQCEFPRKILALCYKVDAAANIDARVKKRCPKDLSYRFHAMTIDSFLISLIRRFYNSLPKWLKIQPDFEIVIPHNGDSLEEQYVKEKKVKDFPDISRKNVNILTCQLSDEIKDFYQYLAEKNKFTYQICHTLAYYILAKNKNIQEIFSKTYQYIFLDEFQDMTRRHYEILKLIFDEDNNKINAVGDYNQAIMSFAGAIPDVFKVFINDFDVTKALFSYNFRSSAKITNFINKLVIKLTPSGEAHHQYRNVVEQADSTIEYKQFHSVEDEAKYIADRIVRIKSSSSKLLFGDFAIILRQRVNDYLERVVSIFNNKNILVRNEDKKIYNHITIQDLMTNIFSNFIISMLKIKCNTITIEEHKNVINVFSNLLSLDLERSRDLKTINKFIQEIIKLDFVDADKWIDNIINLITEKKIETKLFNNKREYNEIIQAIKIFLQECYDISKKDFLLTIDEYLGINTVKIMTTHKSKGLEFDTVFFANFSDSSWWGISRNKKEELRIFYVGLTRAKKRLFFTSSDGKFPKEILNILNECVDER